MILLALPLSLSFGSPFLWLVPAALLAVALARLAYPGGDSPLTPAARRVLRGLRGAGWFVVFLLILAPVLRWPEAFGGRFRVVWLSDRSLSMELPAHAAGSPSRGTLAEAARGAVHRALGGRLDFVDRAFARTLSDSAGAGGAAFRGSTALGDVLGSSGALTGGRPAAIVMVSDGVTTQGEEAWTGAERLGLPVFAVLAGDSAVAPDAAISEVAVNSTAYVRRPTPVQLTLRSRGLAGRKTEAVLSENGHVLSRSPVVLPREGDTELALPLTPETPGVHFYDVSLTAVPGELTELNNHRVFAIEVLADKAHVVLIQGAPGFDFSFLRRSLEEEPDLAPEFWLAGPGGNYMKLDASESASPGALAARLENASVIVLGDLAGAPGLNTLLPAVGARVRQGAGLWVYAGARPEGLQAYRGTALQGLLPFAVESGARSGTQSAAPEPAAEARGDAMFGENGLDADALKHWDDLPPSGGVQALALRGGARRLLVASRNPNQALGATLQPADGGRVFALNAAQVYRWTFTAQGAPGGNDVFPAFLSRMWRWLNEPSGGKALTVRPARRVVGLGEVLSVDVTGVKPGEVVRLEATDAHGAATPIGLTPGSEGNRHGDVILETGRYRLVARALIGGRETSRDQTEVAVEPTGPEWLDSAPDAGSLRRAAAVSGGRYFVAADSQAIARALVSEAHRPRGTRELALHREPWPYALALLLFGTEWWVRRRRGLP